MTQTPQPEKEPLSVRKKRILKGVFQRKAAHSRKTVHQRSERSYAVLPRQSFTNRDDIEE